MLCEAGPISEEETQQLGRLIGVRFTNVDWDHVKSVIRRQFPCSFAVFLVFQGIYGYKGGDFWSGVRESTDLDLSSVQQGEWGRLFEHIVVDQGFARFPLLRGHRFVGPILAHGGIPDSALPIFFDQFIIPWVTRSEYRSMTVREFIDERIRLSSAETELDKPILRFLKFGGKVAEDFADRCRDMAIRTANTGIVPSAVEVGLSPRVTDRFQQWCSERDMRINQDPFRSIRKPILIVEPWGPGLSIYFPPQNTLSDKYEWQLTWQVYAGTTLIEEWTHDTHTVEEAYTSLRQVAQAYRVELTIKPLNHTEHNNYESFKRIWQYPGMTKDCPIMLFDADTQKQIQSKDVLPASRLWIYYYPHMKIKASPAATLRVIEELPQLPWEWSSLIGQVIDLQNVDEFMVLNAITDDGISKFAVYKENEHPLLEGERFIIGDDGAPLYIGSPLNLRIPLHGTSLYKWHIIIHNETYTSSNADIHLDLESLNRQGYLVHEHKFVMLELDRYLGTSPLGSYRVTVRGPLGHKFDIPFRMLPFLDMVGHDALHLPEEGEPEIQFLLETSSDVAVTLQRVAGQCKVELVDDGDSTSTYKVTVGENVSDVPLHFSSREINSNTSHVNILVPIRRLRWMVILDEEEKWQTTPLHLTIERLEQCQEPYLLVDLFGGACDELEAVLLLVDGNDVTLQEERLLFKKAQNPVRFDLRAFLDTIRCSSSPFSLKLRLRKLPNHLVETYIPFLFVTRGFHVENLKAKTLREKDTVHVSLRWQPTIPLRHRFVRFWPVWRPWEKPLMIKIPDKAQRHYDISFPLGDLKPGRYRLEFGVRNPWITERSPVIPRKDDSAVFSVLIPQDAPERRLNELANLANMEQVPLAVILERACIRCYLGQQEMAHADFQWCIDNLDTVGVEMALEVENCVSTDPDLSKELYKKLSGVKRLEETIRKYQNRRLSEEIYRKYLLLLRRNRALSSDACEVLLKIDDEELRLYAARQLLQSASSSAVQAVLNWVKKNEISDVTALSLLKNNLPLTVAILKEAFPDRVAIDLLNKLSKQYPHQVPPVTVRKGYWVRCIAGWGQIERIEMPEGQVVEQFVSYMESKYRLHVLLRAHDKYNVEPVLVDLGSKTVTFLNESDVYTCSECRHFSTQHYGLITSWHSPVAHRAKTLGFCINKSVTLSQDYELEFLAAQPESPWA